MDDLDMARQSQIGRVRVKSIPNGFLHFACAERLGEANIRSSILKIIQCMRGAAHSDDVHTGKRHSQKFADFNTIHLIPGIWASVMTTSYVLLLKSSIASMPSFAPSTLWPDSFMVEDRISTNSEESSTTSNFK